MTTTVVIKNNLVDTFTDELKPNKIFKQRKRIKLRNGAGNDRQGWIYPVRAWPIGAIIVSAKLRVWNGDEWTTSATLTVQSPSRKWSVNKIKFGDQPTGTGVAVSVAKATAPADTMWEFDVTSIVQTASSSGNWYGLRIVTNASFAGWLHSSESEEGKRRPQLIVEYRLLGEDPDGLSPGGGRIVSLQRPFFTAEFNDEDGDTITKQQVQFGSTVALLEAGTTTWDSGEIPADSPEFNSAVTGRLSDGTLWPGLANAAVAAWRVRYKDGSGEWTDYSSAELFQRYTKGTLTITSPTSGGVVYGVSPTISWTFTGRTQMAYQVTIARADAPSELLWDSEYVTSTATSVDVPSGVIDDIDDTYIVEVFVWDDLDREATPGDPMYVRQSRPFTIGYHATDSTVVGLGVSSDPLLPIATLNWNRGGTVTPSEYVILRSKDGGASWKIVEEEDAADLLVSGTAYRYVDNSPPSYRDLLWRVVPVASTNGNMTTGHASTSGEVRRLAPFLYRPNGGDAICFLNPDRPRALSDVQEVVTTLSGDHVLITQSLGLRRGSVSGRLVGDVLQGVSADQMLERFLRLRKDSGANMFVALANETIKCVAFNFIYDPRTDNHGVTYDASFEWVEVR